MSSPGVERLCFLRFSVNAAVYQEVLEHFLIPNAGATNLEMKTIIFQHDRTPAHSAKSTKAWMEVMGSRSSHNQDPIENLWDVVKKRLQKR